MNILRISGMKRDRRPACGLHEQPFFRELIRGHRSGVLACPALTLRSVREASQLRDSAGFEPDFADSRGTPAVCPGYEECSDSTRSPQSPRKTIRALAGLCRLDGHQRGIARQPDSQDPGHRTTEMGTLSI